jgi:Tol biopolymer transport system component
MCRLHRVLFLLIGAFTVLVWASAADAQYFGRNKVQYETFKFKILKTEHFDIYYYPEEQHLADEVGRMAERWNARLTRILDHRLTGRQPLIIYASHPHFEQTNAIQGFLGEGTGGVTEALRRRIVLPAGASLAETDHVVGHELVHAFQYDIGSRNMQRTMLLPLWFVEGMAEYLSIGPNDPHTAMWMRDAVLSEGREDSKRKHKLPMIRDLDDPSLFPYRWGQAFWAYVAGRWGDRIVGDALFAALSGDAIGAVEAVTGLQEKVLSNQWHEALRNQYGPFAGSTQRPTDFARGLITKESSGGELNVAPSLSPDGKRIVFFSERSRISIDLYLADATTGKVARKLISTATDPHFESLQFINSAGSWDPSSHRFALGAIRKGKPVLTILNVENGSTEREVKFDELGEIYHPSWAPDGHAIVFSAIANGLSDLYLYDLKAQNGQGQLRKLTSDAFADLQPSWSPDGKSIAFVTDRFGTKLDTLAYGPYRLALMDVATGQVRALPAFDESYSKLIDPQWSSDGQSIYCMSDHTGITNLYRLRISDGALQQLTNVSTGVSGITQLSPALSVATGAGKDRLALAIYRQGYYEIYTIDTPDRLTSVTPSEQSVAEASTLPPLQRKGAEVAELIANATRGLPNTAATQPNVVDYKPSLQLDYVGQPYVVAGADQFGNYIGGGVSFLFRDMLGDYTVGVLAQISGELDTFAGQLSYLNQKHRWNWGAAISQIPYISGGYSQSIVDLGGGRPGVQQDVVRFNEIHRTVSGVTAYPLDQSTRLEFTGGLHQISFNERVETQIFDLATGQLISDDRTDLPAPRTANLAESSAAFVYDTSLFGPTSPLMGRRARLEVDPTFGSIKYTGVLLDYRQYYMPVKPITLAGRIVHYGRYGSGSEDNRLYPLFLGYSTLVRGYDFNSFDASECVPSTPNGTDCPVFDKLIGTRLFVANAEVRFPLVGIFRRELMYGPVPLEGVVFGDAGIAWTQGQKPKFLSGGTRDWARSLGAGVRVNALGFAVLEFDAVRPLDRPQSGWRFQFAFQPGF